MKVKHQNLVDSTYHLQNMLMTKILNFNSKCYHYVSNYTFLTSKLTWTLPVAKINLKQLASKVLSSYVDARRSVRNKYKYPLAYPKNITIFMQSSKNTEM